MKLYISRYDKYNSIIGFIFLSFMSISSIAISIEYKTEYDIFAIFNVIGIMMFFIGVIVLINGINLYFGKVVINEKYLEIYKFGRIKRKIKLSSVKLIFIHQVKKIRYSRDFIIICLRELSPEEQNACIDLSISGDRDIVFFHYKQEAYYYLKRLINDNKASIATQNMYRKWKIKIWDIECVVKSIIFSMLSIDGFFFLCYSFIYTDFNSTNIEELFFLLIVGLIYLLCECYFIYLAILNILFIFPIKFVNDTLYKRYLLWTKELKVTKVCKVKYGPITCYEICEGECKEDSCNILIMKGLRKVLIRDTPANTCILNHILKCKIE